MKRVFLNAIFCLLATTLIIGCNDDDNNGTGGENSGKAITKYIVAAAPVASEGVADYLLLADNLDQGSISTVGNGVEQDGSYRYYVQNGGTFVSLLYGQGNPGAVTAYTLGGDGELRLETNFVSETVAAFGAVNNDVLMLKISRSIDSPTTNWYRLGMNTLTFDAEGTINQAELTSVDNEIAYFSWVTQATENKVYLPYFSMFASREMGNSFGTNNPDNAFIAVYSYPEMKYLKTITDDRTSFHGRYFMSSITVDEKGDAYVFSPSFAQNANYEFNSTKASAITQVNTETDEFTDYYFNIEAATDGKFITNWTYAGNGKFLANLGADRTETGAYGYGKHFAIVDVYNKTVTPVAGVPEASTILQITDDNCLATEDGRYVYTAIRTEDADTYIYKIDIANASATRGLKVEGGHVTAIHKITYTPE